MNVVFHDLDLHFQSHTFSCYAFAIKTKICSECFRQISLDSHNHRRGVAQVLSSLNRTPGIKMLTVDLNFVLALLYWSYLTWIYIPQLRTYDVSSVCVPLNARMFLAGPSLHATGPQVTRGRLYHLCRLPLSRTQAHAVHQRMLTLSHLGLFMSPLLMPVGRIRTNRQKWKENSVQ